MAIRKEKRKERRGAKATASVESGLAQLRDEIRLTGKPLREKADEELFVVDTRGADQIRSRLGVKKELFIDRILKPQSKITIPPQRIRKTKTTLVAKSKSAGGKKQIVSVLAAAYDMWDTPSDEQGSKKTFGVKVAPASAFSYKPDPEEQVKVLAVMELAEEQRLARQAAKQARRAVIPAEEGEGETMELRADRELLAAPCVNEESSEAEEEDMSVLSAAARDLRKKTKTERNKEEKRKDRMRQAARERIERERSKQLIKLKAIAQELKTEEATEAALQELKMAEGQPRRMVALQPTDIPLLPDEVPSALRALSASVNPLRDQYNRIRKCGLLERAARKRKLAQPSVKEYERYDHRHYQL